MMVLPLGILQLGSVDGEARQSAASAGVRAARPRSAARARSAAVPGAPDWPPPPSGPDVALLEEHAGDAKAAARAQSRAFRLIIECRFLGPVVGCMARSIFTRAAFPVSLTWRRPAPSDIRRTPMAPRFRPLSILALPTLALALALAMNCATTTNPNAAKYPPRPGGCKIRVFHTPAPDVKEWDDLGVAHVDCPLDVGSLQCLRKLRMDACRMGGDILYDVPKKPLRPTEQGMVYTGHVAHTKERVEPEGKDNAGKDSDDAGAGELEQQEGQSSGPIQAVGADRRAISERAAGSARPHFPAVARPCRRGTSRRRRTMRPARERAA